MVRTHPLASAAVRLDRYSVSYSLKRYYRCCRYCHLTTALPGTTITHTSTAHTRTTGSWCPVSKKTTSRSVPTTSTAATHRRRGSAMRHCLTESVCIFGKRHVPPCPAARLPVVRPRLTSASRHQHIRGN